MKDYGRIYGVFWTSGDIKPLGDQAKLLAAYLLTCTHSTIAGTFYLPGAYVAEDMAWGSETVSKAFAELSDSGFATHCPITKWVWVRKFLQWNPPENPNQWKAVRKMVEKVPSRCQWVTEFERSLNPSETVTEPVGGPVEPFQQPVGTVSKSVSVSVSVSGTGTVEEKNPLTPKGGGAVGKALHEQVLAAYHELLPELPAVRDWSERRRRKLEARVSERLKAGKPADQVSYWRALFAQVQASDFLCGRKSDWRCPGLEWLLEPKNFTKVIEGAYRNNDGMNGHAR